MIFLYRSTYKRDDLLDPGRARLAERAHEDVVIPCLEGPDQLIGCILLPM